MDRNWFFSDGDEQFGPVSIAVLEELIDSGEITKSTLIWQEEFDGWKAAELCFEIEKLFDKHAPPKLAESGAAPTMSENVSYSQPKHNRSTNEVSEYYVLRHWRGENSLAWAYWVNGIVLNMLGLVGVTIIDESYNFSVQYWLIMMVALIGISVWSLVGIWRSAGNYIIDAQNSISSKSPSWGYIAKFVVVLGALQNVPIVIDMISIYEVDKSDISNQYFIDYVGETDVVLNGYINDRSVSALKSIFSTDPNRSALIIDSPGGLLGAAFELADFVEAGDIVVAVKENCASACLLVLASANISAASTDAALAFHHPESTADFISTEIIDQGDDSVGEYYSRFRRYGIPEPSLERYRQAGWTDLSLGEAHINNIIDLIWDERANEFHDPIDLCSEVDCYVTPVVIDVAVTTEMDAGGAPPARDTLVVSDNDIDSVLLQMSNQVNQDMQLPTMIDADTRLDRTESGEGIFTYVYTLVNFSKDELSASEFENAMTPELVSLVCSSDNTAFFVENEIPVSYAYNEKNGIPFVTITIATTDCEALIN